jgi:hypothetical protein
MVENFALFRQGLPTNEIWYNDWQDDTKHLRVTVWVDEFGMMDGEDDIGPHLGKRAPRRCLRT